MWLAVGHTDMRRGMNSLAVQVEQALKRDPHAGDLYVFRGKRGHLIKILWHDGIGMSLYAKRLERGRFIWPSPADGTVAITSAQLAYMLDGIDWRNPVRSWRPEAAGHLQEPRAFGRFVIRWTGFATGVADAGSAGVFRY